ncbi:MAG: hypothetical protein KGY78_00875 [Anaerolineae bacterium]|nr:hypothetical protein [Anaerolineae bacterium]
MKRGYLAALVALAVLTLLSLAFNGVVVLEFLRLRRTAHRVVIDARSLVTDVADDTFSYTVEVDQEVPISTEIPFNETLSVPINTVIPISTTVVVPVNLGFRTYELALPIQAVFPIDMEVTVPISEAVDITTVVPLKVDVPIEIAVSDTPLAGYLRDLNATLRRTEQQLERPIWQR